MRYKHCKNLRWKDLLRNEKSATSIFGVEIALCNLKYKDIDSFYRHETSWQQINPTVKYSLMNSVPKLFSCCCAVCWTENHLSTEFGVLTPNHTHSHTLFWGCVSRWFGRALAWHARGHRFDPGNLHQKSTVLRRKYGAFLFVEADFWGLHCFACTVFRLL